LATVAGPCRGREDCFGVSAVVQRERKLIKFAERREGERRRYFLLCWGGAKKKKKHSPDAGLGGGRGAPITLRGAGLFLANKVTLKKVMARRLWKGKNHYEKKEKAITREGERKRWCLSSVWGGKKEKKQISSLTEEGRIITGLRIHFLSSERNKGRGDRSSAISELTESHDRKRKKEKEHSVEGSGLQT